MPSHNSWQPDSKRPKPTRHQFVPAQKDPFLHCPENATETKQTHSSILHREQPRTQFKTNLKLFSSTKCIHKVGSNLNVWSDEPNPWPEDWGACVSSQKPSFSSVDGRYCQCPGARQRSLPVHRLQSWLQDQNRDDSSPLRGSFQDEN